MVLQRDQSGGLRKRQRPHDAEGHDWNECEIGVRRCEKDGFRVFGGGVLDAVVEQMRDESISVPSRSRADGIGELIVAIADRAPLGEQGYGCREYE